MKLTQGQRGDRTFQSRAISDAADRHFKNVDQTESKRRERLALEKMVQEFIENGGKIRKVRTGQI